MKMNKTKMCEQCPFRADAPRGWLGPHSPAQLNKIIHGETPFACHVDRQRFLDDVEVDVVVAGVEHCVGIMRYRDSVCKRPRDRDAALRQDLVADLPDDPIIPPFQFVAHHEPDQ